MTEEGTMVHINNKEFIKCYDEIVSVGEKYGMHTFIAAIDALKEANEEFFKQNNISVISIIKRKSVNDET